jgi:hypothetical protein
VLAATRRGPTPCWLHQVCSRTRQHARAHSLPFFPSFPTHADPYLTPLSPMLFAVPCPCPSATRLCCEGRRLLPSLVSPSPWGVAQATRRSGPCRPRRRAHHHPCHHLAPIGLWLCCAAPRPRPRRACALCVTLWPTVRSWLGGLPPPTQTQSTPSTCTVAVSACVVCTTMVRRTTFALYKQSANST